MCVNFIISSYEEGPTPDRVRHLRLFPLRVIHPLPRDWKKEGLLSIRDTVVHKFSEKRQQNTCHEDHLKKVRRKNVGYIERLSSPTAYSRFTNFIHLNNKQ